MTPASKPESEAANHADVKRRYQLITDMMQQAANRVADPELPFLQIGDLGILRSVSIEGTTIVAMVSPTYTGCPAVSVIEDQVEEALTEALGKARGLGLLDEIDSSDDDNWQVRVQRQISPAWTTDWITAEGHRKLKANGIAPPAAPSVPSTNQAVTKIAASSIKSESVTTQLFETVTPECPYCESERTECVSQFGSTPCKSQHRCLDCREPFDYFKCLR